ncbi:MAG: hypothetical protein ACRDZ3_06965 [Acidimicrobiia bacterium]
MSGLVHMWWLLAWCGLGLALAVALTIARRAREETVAADGDADWAGGSSMPPARTIVRFELHVLLIEMKESYLVVDGLADMVDQRGRVFGVPVSLFLARPPSRFGENLLLGDLVDDAGDKRCQLKLDLTEGRSSVTLLPPQGSGPIPVQAASGLPSPF